MNLNFYKERALNMKYALIEETIYDDELGKYTTFGIISTDGYKISDISTNKKLVENLILTINKKQTPKNYLLYEIDKLYGE